MALSLIERAVAALPENPIREEPFPVPDLNARIAEKARQFVKARARRDGTMEGHFRALRKLVGRD